MGGIVLLLAGRKFFWLFVTVAGFYSGFKSARVLVTDQPRWLAAVAAG